MYRVNKLKEYIDVSVLKIVNENFRIRLSKQLAKKFESGVYAKEINNLADCIEQIRKLGLYYPANATPIFYVYLVSDDDFIDLLEYPYKTRKGGGRPVPSYDIDGFNYAYGLSQNILENVSGKEPSIYRTVNDIHEFAHLVHSQFFYKNRFISEGFAETLPLYSMGYESKFYEHRNALKDMKSNQIFSPKKLIDMEKNKTFVGEAIIPNRSCSFDLSYISSYLFVRGCVEEIASKFNINRVKATQKFLEIVRSSQCKDEWLVFDLANALGIPKEELLNTKKLQIKTWKKL